MKPIAAAAETTAGKGVIFRLFGVMLIFVGMLDSMLNWRAGLGITGFYIFLIIAGLAVYAVGAIRRHRDPGTFR
jgi:predicted lipid-binding transport protein (Tim44 family)